METIYDVAIVGGGPAGCAAAVYAARKSLSAILITDTFGGQSVVSDAIYNWIGTPTISGIDLARSLEAHVRSFDNLSVQDFTRVENIMEDNGLLRVHTDKGVFTARSVMYTLGSSRRALPARGADIFEHKGVTYCASCDGPLFSGQDVAVVGAGNAAFESALQLLAYCSSVTLIHRRSDFTADPQTIAKAQAHPNFRVLQNAIIDDIYGESMVTGLTYHTIDAPDTQIQLPVAGIFVEIGGIPNTEPVKALVRLNEHGYIIVDPRTGKTSHSRIWAAGDCTDGLYHQNNIAAGDAVKALEDLYLAI